MMDAPVMRNGKRYRGEATTGAATRLVPACLLLSICPFGCKETDGRRDFKAADRYVLRIDELGRSDASSFGHEWLSLEVTDAEGKRLVSDWISKHQEGLDAADALRKFSGTWHGTELYCLHGDEIGRRWFVTSTLPAPKIERHGKPRPNIPSEEVVRLTTLFKEHGRRTDWELRRERVSVGDETVAPEAERPGPSAPGG